MNTAWRLSDMAVTHIRAVRPDDSLREARALMDGFNVDQVPILDAAGALVGIVNRRRLVHVRREDWRETSVRDIEWPQYEPTEVLRSPDTLLDSVFDYLFENDFVLIAEDGENVTGIVTINDVAKFLYEQARQN